MNDLAPVLILTLCRYQHFKRCVESLSACIHSDKTDLYVALDHPFDESHVEGYNQILDFVDKISGFKSVILIKRDINYGVLKNFNDATQLIFQKHDRYIVSEDDNYFSPNFLEYINKGLDKYESRKDIFAINGYNYPINIPNSYKKNIYLWKGLSGWGYGIWKDRWINIDTNFESSNCFESVRTFLSEKQNIQELNKYASHYFPSLLRMVNTKRVRGDTFVNMHIIKNQLLCVFPIISKVRNYGHDGSGVHCGATENDIYSKQEIDLNDEFEFDDDIENENDEIYMLLKKYFRRTWKSYIKTKILNFKFILNNNR